MSYRIIKRREENNLTRDIGKQSSINLQNKLTNIKNNTIQSVAHLYNIVDFNTNTIDETITNNLADSIQEVVNWFDNNYDDDVNNNNSEIGTTYYINHLKCHNILTSDKKNDGNFFDIT
nr:9064_t:CDS:2 [Entrophospora candida]